MLFVLESVKLAHRLHQTENRHVIGHCYQHCGAGAEEAYDNKGFVIINVYEIGVYEDSDEGYAHTYACSGEKFFRESFSALEGIFHDF